MSTPGLTTVAEVAGALGVPEGALLKAYPVIVRGRHRPARAGDAAGRSPRQRDQARQRPGGARAARRGPRRSNGRSARWGSSARSAWTARSEILLDSAVADGAGDGAYVAGANRPDEHLQGVVPGRDFPFREVDVRTVEPRGHGRGQPDHDRAGDRGRQHLQARAPATPSPWGPATSTRRGPSSPIWMGSYGIGPARIVAAAVEQFADEHGISWPRALAPFAVHLVVIGKPGTTRAGGRRGPLQRPFARVAWRSSTTTVMSDRGRSSPMRSCSAARCELTVGRRSLESGQAEVQLRRGRREGPGLALGGEPEELLGAAGPAVARSALSRCWAWTAPVPPPSQTRAGQPLRPWTIPNAIGFLRLALIPVFLVVAFSSGDGTGARAGDHLRGHRLGGLRGRDRRPRHPPVQPPGSPHGPGHGPPAGRIGGRRGVAFPPAAEVGAGGPGGAGAADARPRPLCDAAGGGAAHQLARAAGRRSA